MDENQLFEIIKKNTESEYVDFKKEIYNFSVLENKEEFLKDVLSMANSKFKGDKYIIFGVKEEGISRSIVGVSPEQFKDQATYQQLIRDNIEPDIKFEMKMFQKDDHILYCFIINGDDRPYIAKKMFGKIRPGFSHMRINTSRTPLLRRDFDEIYEEKENFLQMKFAKLKLDQNECSKELLLIRMIKSNYNYISTKLDEFEYDIDGFISTWERISNSREFRDAVRIDIDNDSKNIIDKIAGYHIRPFDVKILFNILAECKYKFYENYVEIVEKISSDFTIALQYEEMLNRFDIPQEIVWNKKMIMDFISNLKRIRGLFHKKTKLIWGEPNQFYNYYQVLDNRIDELQAQLDKIYILMEEVNQKLFTVLID
ncbi:MAG: ATP-binding protein [Prevotella sp.]|jgi:hypothetical protein|nr:ATP-binding protein [Prevotella sp.]